MSHGRRLIPLILVGAGVWLVGSGSWIYTKAWLAQQLLERAWQQTLAGASEARPWPWADTWTVGRLRIPSQHIDTIVLQGDSGRSLAFAPGLAAGSAAPGQTGTTLISAHRDTHFRKLAGLTPGDMIELQTTAGNWNYRVTGSRIIDTRHQSVTNNGLQDELVLATCYPFDAVIPGGPLRYLVYAEVMPAKRVTSSAYAVDSARSGFPSN